MTQPPFYSRDTHEMYDNILHKSLVKRPGASSTAWSLLEGLLEKDGTHRLGSRDDFVGLNIWCFVDCFRTERFSVYELPLVVNQCILCYVQKFKLKQLDSWMFFWRHFTTLPVLLHNLDEWEHSETCISVSAACTLHYINVINEFPYSSIFRMRSEHTASFLPSTGMTWSRRRSLLLSHLMW